MAEDQGITRFAVTHPWLWGAVAGSLFALWGGVALFPGEWWPWAVGIAFGLANALAWRENGPAHSLRAWMLRRFPKRE